MNRPQLAAAPFRKQVAKEVPTGASDADSAGRSRSPDRARERVSGVPVGAFRCFQGDAALKHIGYKGREIGDILPNGK